MDLSNRIMMQPLVSSKANLKAHFNAPINTGTNQDKLMLNVCFAKLTR